MCRPERGGGRRRRGGGECKGWRRVEVWSVVSVSEAYGSEYGWVGSLLSLLQTPVSPELLVAAEKSPLCRRSPYIPEVYSDYDPNFPLTTSTWCVVAGYSFADGTRVDAPMPTRRVLCALQCRTERTSGSYRCTKPTTTSSSRTSRARRLRVIHQAREGALIRFLCYVGGSSA